MTRWLRRNGQEFEETVVPYACRKDQALAAKRHYDANRAACIERAKIANGENRRLIKLTIFTHLKDHPCLHCGEADPIVLEFDHRVHAEKKFDIGNAVNKGVTLKRLLEEIEKCDVLCANCHRRKTYHERGHSHKG